MMYKKGNVRRKGGPAGNIGCLLESRPLELVLLLQQRSEGETCYNNE